MQLPPLDEPNELTCHNQMSLVLRSQAPPDRVSAAVAWHVQEWLNFKWGAILAQSALPTDVAHPDVRLRVQSGGSDRSVWRCHVRHTDGTVQRYWEAQMCLLRDGPTQLLAIRNRYVGAYDPAIVRTKPRYVAPVLDRIPFYDGRYSAGSDVLRVHSAAAFHHFCDHLLDAERRLPLLVLVEGPRGPSIAAPGLAKRVAGLAHVVSLLEAHAAALPGVFGPLGIIPPRGAKLFLANIDYQDTASRHPAWPADFASRSKLESLIRDTVYENSVSPDNLEYFDSLWSTSSEVLSELSCNNDVDKGRMA